jgi:hypothetical protein
VKRGLRLALCAAWEGEEFIVIAVIVMGCGLVLPGVPREHPA